MIDQSQQSSDLPVYIMKKALFIYGGWEGHEPKESAEFMAPFLEKEGFEVLLSDKMDTYSDLELLKSMDLIIPTWTMGELSNEQCSNLNDVIEAGTGLGGWHGGLGDAFRNNFQYQMIVGGQFVGHPGNIKNYRVNITKGSDPIMEGLNDFDMHSEQYYMHVDPTNEVLATTTFDGDPMPWIKGAEIPVVWKRKWGKGRVFYSSLCHVVKDFEVTEALDLTLRGLLWAAR